MRARITILNDNKFIFELEAIATFQYRRKLKIQQLFPKLPLISLFSYDIVIIKKKDLLR